MTAAYHKLSNDVFDTLNKMSVDENTAERIVKGMVVKRAQSDELKECFDAKELQNLLIGYLTKKLMKAVGNNKSLDVTVTSAPKPAPTPVLAEQKLTNYSVGFSEAFSLQDNETTGDVVEVVEEKKTSVVVNANVNLNNTEEKKTSASSWKKIVGSKSNKSGKKTVVYKPKKVVPNEVFNRLENLIPRDNGEYHDPTQRDSAEKYRTSSSWFFGRPLYDACDDTFSWSCYTDGEGNAVPKRWVQPYADDDDVKLRYLFMTSYDSNFYHYLNEEGIWEHYEDPAQTRELRKRDNDSRYRFTRRDIGKEKVTLKPVTLEYVIWFWNKKNRNPKTKPQGSPPQGTWYINIMD